ncbi:hypothetical protein [Burkholderia sp. HI2714]|uniref:hypothetical protein n=1 Tax=Burkholderia sp. HI2714 TaxID=2015359 RepID=UPI00211AE3FD|nr:hypothetical protein [Burkholderia sp. HI2714]
MLRIVHSFLTLEQHLRAIVTTPRSYHPERCPHCGRACLWAHGFYERKADRSSGGALNSVPVPRYCCAACGRTCSKDPMHIKTLQSFKRAAREHRGVDGLTKAVPMCQVLLVRAAERGANIGAITTALLRLLDRYGAAEVRDAVEEALRTGSPHSNTVRLVLERRRIARGAPPPVEINLPEHVRNKDSPVQPHRLDTYDQLSTGNRDDDTDTESRPESC